MTGGVAVSTEHPRYAASRLRCASSLSMNKQKHIFVIGLDEFNQRTLDQVAGAQEGRYVYHELLPYEAITTAHAIDFEEILEAAREVLRRAPVEPDAIVGYWDFPTSSLMPILAREQQLPAPSLEAVLRCEHKYWSRVCQRELMADHVPAFAAVDPFAVEEMPLPTPFWIKPIKAWSSQLGFKIGDEEDWKEALAEIRAHIDHFARPFEQALGHAELPPEIQEVSGRFCLAEAIIGGQQCTVEGYASGGEVRCYGIVDSIRHTNGSTFSRYQYPSHLPPAVCEQVRELSKRVIEGIGYDDGVFNIEYFYDPEKDQLWLLEINPRISQSHAFLFADVDGSPNHEKMIEVALGHRPTERRGSGPYGCAAKLFYRTTREDAVVHAVPSEEEIREIEQSIEGVAIEIPLKPGSRLSELADQDSYSYELARIHVGAADEGELLQKYQECVDRLPFDFDEPPEATTERQPISQRVARESFPSLPESLPGLGEHAAVSPDSSPTVPL